MLPTKRDREWLLSFDFRIKSRGFAKSTHRQLAKKFESKGFSPLASPLPAKLSDVAFLRHERKLKKSAKKQGDTGASGRTEGSCSPCNHVEASWAGRRPATQQTPWLTTEATCKKRMRRDPRLEHKQC